MSDADDFTALSEKISKLERKIEILAAANMQMVIIMTELIDTRQISNNKIDAGAGGRSPRELLLEVFDTVWHGVDKSVD